jgi:hypothetical protein
MFLVILRKENGNKMVNFTVMNFEASNERSFKETVYYTHKLCTIMENNSK